MVFDPLQDSGDSIYLGAGTSWSVVDHHQQLDAKADRRQFSLLWDTWSSLFEDGLTRSVGTVTVAHTCTPLLAYHFLPGNGVS